MMFFNPFRPDKQYYRRTFSQAREQFIEMLIGTWTHDRLGILDYLLVLPGLLIWIDWKLKHYPWSTLLVVIRAPLLALNFIIAHVICLPLFYIPIYLYNRAMIYLSKSITNTMQELEIMPIERNPGRRCIIAKMPGVGTAFKAMSGPEVYDHFKLDYVNDSAIALLFESGEDYYWESRHAVVKTIKKTERLKMLPYAKNRGMRSHRNDEVFFNELGLDFYDLYSSIHGNNFFKAFYDRKLPSQTTRKLGDEGFESAMVNFRAQPICVTLNNEKRLILGLFQGVSYTSRWGKKRIYGDGTRYFIIPCRKNRAAIEALIAHDEFGMGNIREMIRQHPEFSDVRGDVLTDALRKNDVYEAVEKRRSAVRVNTPLWLLESLQDPRAQQGILALQSIITDYADMSPTPEESEKISQQAKAFFDALPANNNAAPPAGEPAEHHAMVVK